MWDLYFGRTVILRSARPDETADLKEHWAWAKDATKIPFEKLPKEAQFLGTGITGGHYNIYTMPGVPVND